MSDPTVKADRLLDLAEAVCNRTASKNDLAELKSLLLVDQTSCRRYLLYCEMHAALRFEVRADRAAQKVCHPIDIKSITQAAPEVDVPDVDTPSSPFPTLLSTTLPGTVGWFSSGWPVAYLIATVIFGLGLLIGSVVHVSELVQVARQSSLPSRVAAEPKTELVGRITGMVDCKWAGTAFDSPSVPLGRKYELASGLVEITYDTGAKVILQGPVTYEVESASGGYLAVGKLTGKVTTEKAKGFAVRTPTATVTDLGTEFGVEVGKEGHTISHVFRGSVRVQAVMADGQTEGNARVLRENESIQVVRSGGKQADNRVVVFVPASKPSQFVREMPKRTIKVFDLVDVVAGGDGFSGRRNRGIDPTGKVSNPPAMSIGYTGDYQYHHVEGIPFVDGVFIPDGRRGPVQVTSAGHTSDLFLETKNVGVGPVWAGGPVVFANSTPVPTKLDGVDYASPGHGLLYFGANKGLTFDLEAIRRANPGCKLLQFRSTAARQAADERFADVWVLVDGEARFRRRQINRYTGAMPILVPIGDKDRFLTLAASDGGDDIWGDDIIFGDPQLEMLGKGSTVAETQGENRQGSPEGR